MFHSPIPKSRTTSKFNHPKIYRGFSVKDLSPRVYTLYSRHCALGTKQIKGLDFQESYAPFFNSVIEVVRAFCFLR